MGSYSVAVREFSSFVLQCSQRDHPLFSLGCGVSMTWPKLSFMLLDCPQVETASVEPYNAVVCAHSLLERTDVTVMSTARLCTTLPASPLEH